MTALIQGYTDQEKAIDLNDINFSTSKGFNYSTVAIVAVLAVIYGLLW